MCYNRFTEETMKQDHTKPSSLSPRLGHDSYPATMPDLGGKGPSWLAIIAGHLASCIALGPALARTEMPDMGGVGLEGA